MNKDLMQIILLGNTQLSINEIVKCNSYTVNFGLSLTNYKAKQLVNSKKQILKTNERIEFDGGIIEKIIFAFCDSQFIHQDIYVETLNELIEVFYRYKNETMDLISDDELIEVMRDVYENKCYGEIEYMDGTCLEEIARKIRRNEGGINEY